MLSSLRKGGHAVFTVSQKHLSEDSSFGMGYFEAITGLIKSKAWTPIAHYDFVKYKGSGIDSSALYQEPSTLFIFRKE